MTQEIVPDKQIGSVSRMIAFIVGLFISSLVFVWGFNYRLDYIAGQTFTFMGFDFTGWLSIAIIVLIGVFGGYLIQVGIRGKTGF
jgi:hypothetical protein